jgi:hypothetical protein
MTHRRDLLRRAGLGAGSLGLRALATGLPASLLARPLAARAEDFTCASKAKAQSLIISISSAGDPLNCNVPGTYDFPDIVHAADPKMAPAPLAVGDKTFQAAQLWSTLPRWVLDRTVFFHHATLTNNHSNLGKVLRLMGAAANHEMLPSLLAKHLAPCLGTIQVDPISAGAGDILDINGRSLPNIAPTGLRDLLTRPNTPLQRLEPLRDRTLDEIHDIFKQRGTTAQLQLLDRLALSRQQSRKVGSDLLDMLSAIKSNKADGQIPAAVALIKMNLCPVVAIRIDFGGDNHTDQDLMAAEVPGHEAGIAFIGQLMQALQAAQLQDQVTFAAYNVFGRTLRKNGLKGRDHWGSHHTTLMIGKPLRPGVVGGLMPKAGDYYATPIDSRTGSAMPAGADIPFAETLSAAAKTLGAAVGVDAATLDRNITGGKVVQAALA